jgi:hypothetical protein
MGDDGCCIAPGSVPMDYDLGRWIRVQETPEKRVCVWMIEVFEQRSATNRQTARFRSDHVIEHEILDAGRDRLEFAIQTPSESATTKM